MRHLLCWLIFIPMAVAADWKIDHATIAGPNLENLRSLLASVGATTEYGGPHSSGLTEMAITAFADGSYLELIAWRDLRAPHAGQSWAQFLDQQAGPCAWAIQAPDIGAETGRLKAAGISVTETVRGGRVRPDGVKLEWETAGIGPGDRGSLFPFLIHDFTPRDRRVYPSGKPTTQEYFGISLVVIGVRDLNAAVAQYRRAFGLPVPEKQLDGQFGATLARFTGTPVVLAEPLDAKNWLATRLDRFGDAPCAFVLAGWRPAPGSTRWFGQNVRWFDAPQFHGMRLGATVP